MEYSKSVLKNDEKAVLDLRKLYMSYGYTQYKMSKFEEYDLYVQNKSFLVSKNIITFNDLNGKLMALKPDVTLSIIKNFSGEKGQTEKYCYNENVYRCEKGDREFKEIVQSGLECIGNVGVYETSEVILLSVKSLELLDDEYLLDLSHMGFVTALLDEADVTDFTKTELLKRISEKNTSEIVKICNENNVKENVKKAILSLVSIYGSLSSSIEKLYEVCLNEKMREALYELEKISKIVEAEGYGKHINLDFSIVNDMDYYNGIVFQGFIEEIPCGVLSGGRYDNLMKKFGKDCEAIGFAVYLDLLEKYKATKKDYDIDVVLIYGDESDTDEVIKLSNSLKRDNKSVFVSKELPTKLRFKEAYRIKDGGVERLG